jgi:hypothetical protein
MNEGTYQIVVHDNLKVGWEVLLVEMVYRNIRLYYVIVAMLGVNFG